MIYFIIEIIPTLFHEKIQLFNPQIKFHWTELYQRVTKNMQVLAKNIFLRKELAKKINKTLCIIHGNKSQLN